MSGWRSFVLLATLQRRSRHRHAVAVRRSDVSALRRTFIAIKAWTAVRSAKRRRKTDLDVAHSVRVCNISYCVISTTSNSLPVSGVACLLRTALMCWNLLCPVTFFRVRDCSLSCCIRTLLFPVRQQLSFPACGFAANCGSPAHPRVDIRLRVHAAPRRPYCCRRYDSTD